MNNYLIVNLFAILTLLLPAASQTLGGFQTQNEEAVVASEVILEEMSENESIGTEGKLLTMNTFMQDIWSVLSGEIIESATSVTPAVSSQEAAESEEPEPEEPELTPEEELALAFQEWQASFPAYDNESAQTAFIQKLAPAAVLIADAQGIYPSVMLAQAALESNWGRSGLAQDFNNLMGTKGSVAGKSATVRTREVKNGQSVYINAGFTIYDSWAHSLFHYGTLMKDGLSWDSNYYSGTWIENTTTYHDATSWLQGRYASDPEYSAKLNQTIASYDLDKYDDIQSFDSELETTLEKLTALNE